MYFLSLDIVYGGTIFSHTALSVDISNNVFSKDIPSLAIPHAIDVLIISFAEFIGPKVILPVSADVEIPTFKLDIPIANLF